MFIFCLFSFVLASPKRDWKHLQEKIEQGDWKEAKELSTQLIAKDSLPNRELELEYFLEYSKYQLALEENSAKALQSFLREYPDSLFYEAARSQMAELEFQKIISSQPNKSNYLSFLQSYPTHVRYKEVLEMIEELDWKEASRLNTLEAYQNFIRIYPEGQYRNLANEQVALMIYKNVREKDQLHLYMDFIQNYPTSHFVTDARSRSEDLAWAQCRKKNSVDAYRSFHTLYPDSENSDIARQKELDLAWDIVKNAHDIDTYNNFQQRYPNTELSGLAEKRGWDLFEYKRDPYSGELKSNITRIVREKDGRYRLFLDVQSEKGDFVGGLQKESFTIYDAGYRVDDYELEGMESNRSVDVVFVLDVSHSMDDKLQTVKQDIIRFSEIMALRNRDYRLGVVSFVEEIFSINGQDYIYGSAPALTGDPNEFRTWIDNISLQGGSQENDYLGLDVASSLGLREDAQRILILVTDEPPSSSYAYRSHLPIAHALAERDMIVYATGPYTKEFQDISNITGGVHYSLNSFSFSNIMETIIQKISKQYKIRYLRPPNAPPVIDELQVKLRIKPLQALVQANNSNPNLPGSIKMEINPNQSSSLYRLLSNNDAYCSEDKGKNWELCSSEIPPKSVKNIVYDENQPDNMYFHLKDNSVVQLKNKSVVPQSKMKNVQALVNSPKSKSVFYADNQGIYQVLPDKNEEVIKFEEPYNINFLHINEEDDEPEAVLGLSSEEIVRVTQKGIQHRMKNPCGSDAPVFWKSHPHQSALVFLGCKELLMRSTDSGQQWTAITLPEHPEKKKWTISDLLLDTNNSLNLLLTSEGTLQSDNLGKTWRWGDLIVNNTHNIGAAAISKTGSLVLADANKDIVYKLKTVADKEFLFSSLFYESGATKPKEEMFHHLDEVAQKLLNDSSLSLYIEGHTDASGGKKTNMRISRDRATWIADYLISKGVTSERITKQWFGETKPLFPNDTPANQAKNRRVEILFLDNSEEESK